MRTTLETPEFKSWLQKAQLVSPWQLRCIQRGHWIKVIKEDPDTGAVQPMPFCFIELATGTIYRAAHWRFPAKNYAKGNIHDEHNGMNDIIPDGVTLLKGGCPAGYKYDIGSRKVPVRAKKIKPEGSDYVEPPPLIAIPVDPPFIPYPAPRLPVKIRHEKDGNFWGAEDF